MDWARLPATEAAYWTLIPTTEEAAALLKRTTTYGKMFKLEITRGNPVLNPRRRRLIDAAVREGSIIAVSPLLYKVIHKFLIDTQGTPDTEAPTVRDFLRGHLDLARELVAKHTDSLSRYWEDKEKRRVMKRAIRDEITIYLEYRATSYDVLPEPSEDDATVAHEAGFQSLYGDYLNEPE